MSLWDSRQLENSACIAERDSNRLRQKSERIRRACKTGTGFSDEHREAAVALADAVLEAADAHAAMARAYTTVERFAL